MKRSITYAAVSSVLVSCLLMAGTAFADQGDHGGRSDHSNGWAIGATVGATIHGSVVGTDEFEQGEGGVGSSTLPMHGKHGDKRPLPPVPAFQGNGQPIVGGTVTAVGSTTLSITNKSNVNYTVDASSATIRKGNATSSLSSVSVGDRVLVQGAINGSTVTASTIIDQSAQASIHNQDEDNNASSTEQENSGPRGLGNLFRGLGGLGNFLHSLFGFF